MLSLQKLRMDQRQQIVNFVTVILYQELATFQGINNPQNIRLKLHQKQRTT